MKKAVIFIVSVGILSVVVSGMNSAFGDGPCFTSKSESMQCGCSKPTEGLQFCAEISVTPFRGEPGYRITVDDSLRNMSDKVVEIPMPVEPSNLYRITIRGPSGNNLLSEREIVRKKAAEKNEFVNFPTSTKEPLSERGLLVRSLAPNEELKAQSPLSSLYKFESVGKYQIEIARTIQKQDGSGETEISAGPFVFELKPEMFPVK